MRHLECRKDPGNEFRKKAVFTLLRLNMDDVNVKYTGDLVVSQGKTHFEVSLLLKEVYPRRRRLSWK